MAQAKARGIPVPKELDIDDRPGQVNLVGQVRALASMVSQDTEYREMLVDELLESKQQEEGGLIATIKHLDDGEVPQATIAMVRGDDAVGRSRLAQWVDGDWGDLGAPSGLTSALEASYQEAPTPQLSPELRSLAESLLRLIGPTAEAGVQTGGPKEAGRVVRGGGAPPGRAPK